MTQEIQFRLGDERLNQRADLILEKLGEHPKLNFPQIFQKYSELEAFYRFVKNPRVRLQDILTSVVDETLRKIDQEADRFTLSALDPSDGDVLVVHDTTTLIPTGKVGTVEGFGPMSRGKKTGCFSHLSLAVSASQKRKILGPLGLLTWARKQPSAQRLAREKRMTRGQRYAFRRKHRPLKQFESQRWGQQVQQVESISPSLRRRWVHIMDQEADVLWLFSQLKKNESRFVIRVYQNRVVEIPPIIDDSPPSKDLKLSDAFTFDDVIIAQRSVHVSKKTGASFPNTQKAHPARSARIAHLQVQAKQVWIKKTRNSARTEPCDDVLVNVVKVYEPRPPRHESPIEWVLITSEPIETREQVEKIIAYYESRWVIEEYFKALKTGCRLEDRLFGSAEPWYTILGLFLPIATQLCNLRLLSDSDPNGDPMEVLSETQWEILKHRASLEGRHIQTLLEAKLEIAHLGGHIKYSGPPGWLVLARGFESLLLLEQGWRSALQHNPPQYVTKS